MSTRYWRKSKLANARLAWRSFAGQAELETLEARDREDLLLSGPLCKGSYMTNFETRPKRRQIRATT